jgi:hypothetical protein
MTQGEFNECLFVPASEEGQNTAKEDRCEPEQVPHNEVHTARVDWPILD